MDDRIISFEEYRKRKYGNSKLTDSSIAELFKKDLREQTDLLAWIEFHNTFNRYKLFVHSLFSENKTFEKNPNSGFVIAFSEEQVKQIENEIKNAVTWAGKTPFLIKARDITFVQLCEELTGERYKTNYDAGKRIKYELLYSDKVIIISELSKLKYDRKKEHVARQFIKTIDDAHFDNIKPESELIFIDYAAFLQRAWNSIGTYLKIITP